MNRFGVKIVVSLWSLCFAAIIYFNAVYPFRAMRDEQLVAADIVTLLQTGMFQESVQYTNGNGYAILIATILKVTDLSYMNTDMLSPFLGIFVFGFMMLILWKFYDNEGRPDRYPWAIIAPILSIFVFAGFIMKMTETTHNKFTYTLILLAMYLLYYTVKGRTNKRYFLALYLLIGIGITLFNFIWGFIYTGALLVAGLFVNYKLLQYRSVVLLPALTAIPPLYIPTSDINIHYTSFVLLRLLRFVSGISYQGNLGPERDLSGLSEWNTVSIAGFEITVWFFYMLGIFFVAAISAITLLYIGYRLLQRYEDVPQFGRYVFGFSAAIGCLFLALIIAGDISTIKRIIVLPGVLGVLICITLLSRGYGGAPITRKRILVVIIIVLLVTTPLATPRLMQDGDPRPYDFYIKQSELNQIFFMGKYGTVNESTDRYRCVAGADRVDHYAAGKFLKYDIAVINSNKQRIVYDAGKNAKVLYSKNLNDEDYHIT